MRAVDFKLDKMEKEFINDALKDVKGWKECFLLTDKLLSELFSLVELRLTEIKARGHGTLVDD